MTKTYLIQAWCAGPFISSLDEVEACRPGLNQYVAAAPQDGSRKSSNQFDAHGPRDGDGRAINRSNGTRNRFIGARRQCRQSCCSSQHHRASKQPSDPAHPVL